jgi:hypothetical protein
MTGASLISGVRTLLHDAGAGFSNSDPYYLDQEIIDSLLAARQQLVKALLAAPQIPYVAFVAISKSTAAADGSNVPTDFYKLICGYMNDGSYVPAQNIRVGEAMKNTSAQQIYVRGGVFYGTADNAYYWAMPSQAIANSGTTLTEFGDSVYNAIKYHACLLLLAKEDADAKDRFVQISAELKRKLSSLS